MHHRSSSHHCFRQIQLAFTFTQTWKCPAYTQELTNQIVILTRLSYESDPNRARDLNPQASEDKNRGEEAFPEPSYFFMHPLFASLFDLLLLFGFFPESHEEVAHCQHE
ncbi:hypothetical protein VNO77_27170 [Canavalia gladiata]|uniref:Uncharacterized protein n=1 Tax=Canavalia gladiata TaxID=3824 RepID=A0AAN9KWR0_CANGL